MLKTFTLSAVVAAVLAATVSAAFAAPRNFESRNSEYGRVPVSGAEWWQDRGNADEMGSVYRR